MRSGNPVLSDATFRDLPEIGSPAQAMTINGTVFKTGVLLVLAALAAAFTWQRFFALGPAAIYPFLMGGTIVGFVLALVTCFKPTIAAYTSPLYAVAQGLFMGGLSALLEVKFEGIVIQAIGLTFGVLLVMLMAYSTGWIRATENFKLGVVAATGAVALFYFVAFILSFFNVNMSIIWGNGWIGIGFSLVVVTIAALNLVLDFDFIEKGAESGAPKYMEWYGAFGLMVTLVWLYIEVLRLLAKLRGSER